MWVDAPYVADILNPDNTNLLYRLRVLDASPAALELGFETIVSNLTSPTVLTHAGDGSGRLFVAEQTGEILIIDGGGSLLPEPFLDLSDEMTNLTVFAAFGYEDPGLNPFYDERGLLGLAFHPGYETNGRFFVYYSSPKTTGGIDHESIVAEYQVSATNANAADPASESVILRVDQPEFNHNSGQLAFGPDGFLYIGLGDGGGGGDDHDLVGNGQNVSNLLGTITRIDVDQSFPYVSPPDNPFVGSPGRDEIYAFGLRNPYRFSFDKAGTNGLIVADVGQGLWEEINTVTNGGNYGWRIMEGNHAFDVAIAPTVGVDVAFLDYPIHEYKHGTLGTTVIGGYVYRGTNYAALAGSYVFGDFSTGFFTPDGKIYYLEETRPGIWERFEFGLPEDAPLQRYIKGFGEGPDGEIYMLSTTNLGPSGISGDIRRLMEDPQ
jgi:glucose/arabinose dehydrogenase